MNWIFGVAPMTNEFTGDKFTSKNANLVKIISLILALFIAVMGFLPTANAQEVIKSFSSDIIVLKNGSVDVTETITVIAEGLSIRRGIFRDIPTNLQNDNGSLIRSNLNIVSITRDGVDEPYFTEGFNDGIRIYIGESSVFLEPNTYTYMIRYTLTRMTRSFAQYDEIYWNATGNFWDFPIENARATITLPQGAIITEMAAYTGRQGDIQSDAKFIRTSDNSATFRATRSFYPREGMTISVSFEKGALLAPSIWQKFLYFISDQRRIVFPLLAVLLITLYYYFAWDAVGRDPKKRTIIPLFRAPKGYSPALIHYISQMGWKKSGWTAFSAALVSLATKGLLVFNESGKNTTLKAIGNAKTPLPRGETIIDNYMRTRGELVVNKGNGPGLKRTKDIFLNKIQTENRNAYFFNNYLYVAVGLGFSIISIIALLMISSMSAEAVVPAVTLVFIAGVFSAVFLGRLTGPKFMKFSGIIMIGIFLINFGTGFIVITGLSSLNMEVISTMSIIALNLIFAGLLKAPTIQGRKIMDQIDGFKMYLETAEKNRLNFENEPDFSIKRFEEILPYAIALGVEKPWANRLEGEFSRNTITDSRGGYHPAWHNGARFGAHSISRQVASISSGMSAAMISAQPSSSSSSGGGGGGFSGGGGGGGGGGGW